MPKSPRSTLKRPGRRGVQERLPDRFGATSIQALEHHRNLDRVVLAKADLFAPMRVEQALAVEVESGQSA